MRTISLAARPLVVVALALVLAGCGQVAVPSGARAVTGFEASRYMGTWYEIARLENRFERGLTRVTAQYAQRPDGRLTVINRGYRQRSGQWEEAKGVAAFVGAPTEGRLKVSFFGPFYAGYNVIALDASGYQWAMVAGPTHQYLWILSRQRTIDPTVKAALLEQARAQGFPIESLVTVAQDEPAPAAAPAL